MKLLAISLAASAIALGSSAQSSSPPAATLLRIESVSANPLSVDVSSMPAGLWSTSAPRDSAQQQLRVLTPATVRVGDAVQWLRITVVGNGAVRFSLEGGASPRDRSLPLWGRDITLQRVEGEFRPVAKIIPLYP